MNFWNILYGGESSVQSHTIQQPPAPILTPTPPAPILTPTPPAPKRNQLFADQLFHLLDTVNNDIPKFEPPSIIVFGNENVGKSTLLNRIIGREILPTSKEACTKMAINIKLRSSASKTSDTIKVKKGDVVVKTYKIENPNEDVSGKVRQIMQEAVKDGTCISTELELLVELSGPNFPNLDLVDLPGIPLTSNRAKPAKHVTITNTKKRKGSLLLAVYDANRPVGDTAAMQIINTMDLQSRAIGCITKCDHVVPDNFEEMIVKMIDPHEVHRLEPHVQLGHGYFATMLETKNGNDSWFSRQPGLAKLFESPETKDRLGVEALKVELSKMYTNYLVENWIPTTVEALVESSATERNKFWALGSPIQVHDSFFAIIGDDSQMLSLDVLRDQVGNDFINMFNDEFEFAKIKDGSLKALHKTRDAMLGKTSAGGPLTFSSYDDLAVFDHPSTQVFVPLLQEYFNAMVETGKDYLASCIKDLREYALNQSKIKISRFCEFFTKAIDFMRVDLVKNFEKHFEVPFKARLLQDQTLCKWTPLVNRFEADASTFVYGVLLSVRATKQSTNVRSFEKFSLAEIHLSKRNQICETLSKYNAAEIGLLKFADSASAIRQPSEPNDDSSAGRKKPRVVDE